MLSSFAEVDARLKRLELWLGQQAITDDRLYERINAVTGLTAGGGAFRATEPWGTIVARAGIYGGGSLPGIVNLDVDLHDVWSGLEFDETEVYPANWELRVDLDADFDVWTGLHRHSNLVIMDKFSGSSPYLEFHTGTDDVLRLWADEDPTPGGSDLKLGLAGDHTVSSRFVLEHPDGTNVVAFSSSGYMCMEMDDFLMGRGTSGAGVNDVRFVWDTTPSPSQVKLQDGDLNFDTTGHGIIHIDDGGIGWVLASDGTRFIPTDLSTLPGILPTPSGEGYILRSNATPKWVEYFAGTLGAVLIGNGTTVIADTTPTFVNTVTLDDGSGNSPFLKLVSGSNDDRAQFYLRDDGTAKYSDLCISLAGDTANANLLIKNESLADIAVLDATGNLQIDGDLTFLTGKGIIHADGVAAGYILLANGTRYVPAAAAANLPVVPSGRGYILRSNATPAWEEHLANTDGAALVGDGTDIGSTLTPTWKGVHTHAANVVLDDGSGNSPVLQFVGGSNDDTVKLYLADDAGGADRSDFYLLLAGDAGNSVFSIRNKSAGALIRITDQGDLTFQNSGYGITHTDGNTAGNVLLANGTRYLPAAAAANLPVAPSGRGYILRSNATPAWEEHLANTDGAALVGDGTDIGSTLTPTWKGVHTHAANVVLDDGSGDSPLLSFIGGTNNDTASIYLDDDAGANQSDLRIKLPGNDTNSRLEIHDSGDVAVLEIDANGCIFMDDDQFIGLGAAAARFVFDATPTPDQIELTDGDLALFSGADVIGYSDAGSTETLRLDSSAGYIGVADQVYHIGDPDTYIAFASDQVTIYAGALDIIDIVEAATDETTFKCDVTLNNKSIDTVFIRAGGGVESTESDIKASAQLGLAGTSNVHIFIDAAANSSTDYFSVRRDAETRTGSTELIRVNESGELLINDTSNGNMTIGLTVNQGGNDDEILALKSSDIAHGITDYTETDTFARFTKIHATNGGVNFDGWGDASSTQGIILSGIAGADTTTKTTSSVGVLQLRGFKKNVASVAGVGANGNVVVMRNGTTTRWILDAEGDIFYGGSDDGSITDDHDDVALLTGFRALRAPDDSPVRQVFRETFKQFLDDTEGVLVQQGVLTAPLASGGLVSRSALDGLIIDALRQLYQRLSALEASGGI